MKPSWLWDTIPAFQSSWHVSSAKQAVKRRSISKKAPSHGWRPYAIRRLLANPLVPTSPVVQTVVTNPRGQKTAYRYDTQALLVTVLDSSGHQRNIARDPPHN